MTGKWTFGQKLGGGLAVTTVLTIVTGVVAVWGLSAVAASKDAVITFEAQNLVEAERMHLAAADKVAVSRGYLLTGETRYLDQIERARADFLAIVQRVREGLNGHAEEGRLLDRIVEAEREHQQALEVVIAKRAQSADLNEVGRVFEETSSPKREVLDDHITAFTDLLERNLLAERQASERRTTMAMVVVVVIAVLAVVCGALIALVLARALGRQVGDAVGHIQSSSAELEAAAGQQANGARDQATAMNEITTTINELLVTSRQIAEGAQRVSKVADDTAVAARSGDATIEQARASIAAIRQQVDLIVQHMLELGENSQQIGGVVDLVSELAEQTNILAINATIEASGAGEWGRRFAVVADEIRKLADRTAGSAKEIRALIDDVRGAVNTTVMATETGAKAVDAGSRQFDEVTDSFQRIAGLVATTTGAAREIELSTKQQSTAVEQVNVAIADTARVTRETEASASQTRQTASHLAGLSTTLLRLVSAKAGAQP